MNDREASSSVPESLAVVVFCAGGWRIGIEARHVRGSRPAASTPVAPAAEALLGIADAASGATTRHYLSIKHADGDHEIHVAGPLELLDLPTTSIHPLPRLLAERAQLRGLRAVALAPEQTGQRLTLLVDAAIFPPT